MTSPALSPRRVRALLDHARSTRILVVGDVMLDQFLWGTVSRISPEAPVPVVEFDRESYMPGGAANVARNLAALGQPCELFGAVGSDPAARELHTLLQAQRIASQGLLPVPRRPTSLKTRIVAHQQQLVRVDRESRAPLDAATTRQLTQALQRRLPNAAAVIVADYAKGVVTQPLLDTLKALCRQRGLWLSFDPKPSHHLDLRGVSLLTPNRKEAFELAGVQDDSRGPQPLQDPRLLDVAAKLLTQLQPALLLITLGEHGMLLCQQGAPPFHIATVAQEVFDVSGAGDTVIATFTLAIAAGASPLEAAILSNHAAGLVVGKVGTATVAPEELIRSFRTP